MMANAAKVFGWSLVRVTKLISKTARNSGLLFLLVNVPIYVLLCMIFYL